MPAAGAVTAAVELDGIEAVSAERVSDVENPHVKQCVEDLQDAITALVETADAHEDPILNTRAARVRRRLEDTRRAQRDGTRAPASTHVERCDARLPIIDAVEALDRPEIEYRVDDAPVRVAADPTVVASAARVVVESLTEATTGRGSVGLDRNDNGTVLLSASIGGDMAVADLSRLAGRLQRLIAPVTPNGESAVSRISMSGPEVHVALPAVCARTGAAGTVVEVQLRAA